MAGKDKGRRLGKDGARKTPRAARRDPATGRSTAGRARGEGRGRTSANAFTLTPELEQKILDAIETPRSLFPALKRLGVSGTFYYTLRERWPEFNKKCLCAEERRAAALVDDTLTIADASEHDVIGLDRFDRPIVRDEVVRRSQLRVAVRQWHAARLDPARYGERATHVVTGPGGRPVALSFADLARRATSSGGEDGA